MMTTPPKPPGAGRIDFALPEDDVVIVRVSGRGSFQNSAALKAVPALAQRERPAGPAARRYIVDLEECVTMDSTFFGVLASIGLSQLKAQLGKTVLVNTNSHIRKILETLGLTAILDLHDKSPHVEEATAAGFQQVAGSDLDKVDRIVMMLEAHQRLVDVYDNNAALFKNVMECLEASLETEQRKRTDS